MQYSNLLRKSLGTIIAVGLALSCLFGEAQAFDHSHQAFTNELQKYASMDRVDYERWRQSPKNLKEYLDSLGRISADEYKTFSADEKKALWLNAYNALTIYLVLKNYPINGAKEYYPKNSIRQIDGFWDENKLTIGGESATLAQIEHNLLRRDFRDPRTHFAVVPAAVGGAVIDRVAYSAPGLDLWLDRKTREFLGSANSVRVDIKSGIVYVTQLFRWFPLDFARDAGLGKKFPPPTDDQIILGYIRKKGPSSLVEKINAIGGDDSEIKVVYEPFDWTLNELKCP